MFKKESESHFDKARRRFLFAWAEESPTRNNLESEQERLQQVFLEAGMNPKNVLNLDIRYGFHSPLPNDDQLGQAHVRERSNGPFLNLEKLVEYLMEVANDEKNQPTEPKEKFKPPKIIRLGQGGGLSEDIIAETEKRMKDAKITTIDTDQFGRSEFGQGQVEAQLKVHATAAVITALALFAPSQRDAVRKITKEVNRFRKKDTNQLLDESQDDLSESGKARRNFIASTLATGGLIGGGLFLNHIALNSPILGRQRINEKMGGLFHDTAFTFPEEIFERVNKRDYYLYSSVMTARNYNMALSLIYSMTALSHSQRDFPQPLDTVLAWYGIIHMGLTHEVLQGKDKLNEKFADYSKSMTQDYANWIAQTSDHATKQELLEEFLYISQQVSHPISNYDLKLPQHLELPQSGLSLLWQSIAQVSRETEENPQNSKRQALNLMTRGLAGLNMNVVDKITKHGRDYDIEDNGGPFSWSNTWDFQLQKEFEILLPNYNNGHQQDLEVQKSAVFIQNGSPFLFPVFESRGQQFIARQDSPREPLAVINSLDSPESWQWYVPIRHLPKISVI